LHQYSPCIDNGVDVGINEDFLGNQRPEGSGFDMGAFEYGATNHVAEMGNAAPNSFSLFQNHPNPFNSETLIQYSIVNETLVQLVIHDLLGNCIKRLVHSNQEPGVYTLRWDGTNDSDDPVTSGIYICRMQTGALKKTVKLILIR
jgi:hypothetical protein